MFRNSSPNPFFWQSLGNFNLFYLTLGPNNILGNPQIDKNQLKLILGLIDTWCDSLSDTKWTSSTSKRSEE